MIESNKKKSLFPKNILLLGLVSMFIDMSTEMVYPIMPALLVTLGAAPAIVGVIEGITDGLAATLRVFAGYISDRTQKKKGLAIIGYSAAFFYKIGIIFSTSWAGLFFSKLIDRTGKGLRVAPRDSLIAESAQKGYGKNFGLHKMFDMLGAASGVLLAYFILSKSFEYKTVFYYSLIPAVIGVVVLLFVREKKKDAPAAICVPMMTAPDTAEYAVLPAPDTAEYAVLPAPDTAESESAALPSPVMLNENIAEQPKATGGPKNIKLGKKVWFYLITIFVFSIGNASKAFLLLKAQESGISVEDSLLFYLLLSATASLLSIPLGRLSDKIGRRPLIVCGYLLYAVVYLGFGLSSSPWAIAVLFAFYGVYTAMISGTEKALMVEIAPKHLKGTVLGLQGMAQGIGVLISSILIGVIWQYSGSSEAFYFGAALAFLSAISMSFILSRAHKKSPV